MRINRNSLVGTAALDRVVCLRAFQSRDRRFDGRFFVGVKTTRIYCRPGCPAPLPREQNIGFYASAAAAEDEGFRACRRCRPDASPGTPAWDGTSATVTRALRMLHASSGEPARIEALSDRLGVGSRHLRRLFLQHLGAPPRAIFETRRAHFARRLIDETDLAMIEVAFAAGYGSVRRFNAAMQRSFRMTPTQLRAARRRALPTPTEEGQLELRLPYRPPYDWPALLEFLAPRATPGVEEIDAFRYRRTFEQDGVGGLLEVRQVENEACLILSVPQGVTRDLLPLVHRAQRLFDLDADPNVIGEQLRTSRGLRALVDRRPGLRVPGAWNPFELSVRAILGQQITVTGATTLAGRLVERFGRRLDVSHGALTHLFPTPEALSHGKLETIGLPKARAESIRALARAVASGELRFDALTSLEVAEEQLCALPGIGPWTAQYVAMRALGEPDALPGSDLGLRKAIASGATPESESMLRKAAESWRPWRSYACLHLWQSLTDKTRKGGTKE